MITQERLKELLDYDPETGVFTWRVSPSNRVKPGQIAGYRKHGQYMCVTVCRKKHYLHRLAWLYVYGKLPGCEIDHMNCDPSDNRISNLREALRGQNQANGKARHSGLKGAYWDKSRDRWLAVITVRCKARTIGRFDSEELAHQAYLTAARKEFGEFARAS